MVQYAEYDALNIRMEAYLQVAFNKNDRGKNVHSFPYRKLPLFC
jgi:hypothetical protein